MVKGIFQRLLVKSGKNYQIDPRIPNKLFYQTLTKRATMLLRGFLKTGKKVFVGPNAKILNPQNIVFGKSEIGRAHV